MREPGWLLLPLRGFLGVTFTFAGLQKLANPDYLNAHSPTSVAAQMRLLQDSSPIGPLIGLSTHAPLLVGLLIAFGELAVGVGALLGLSLRIAAAGGALLSLTFFPHRVLEHHPLLLRLGHRVRLRLADTAGFRVPVGAQPGPVAT